jgi:hypothetical protein
MRPRFSSAHRLSAASPHVGDSLRNCVGRFRGNARHICLLAASSTGGGDNTLAVVTLVTRLAGLAEAVAQLRDVQQRVAQAASARHAAERLHAARAAYAIWPQTSRARARTPGERIHLEFPAPPSSLCEDPAVPPPTPARPGPALHAALPHRARADPPADPVRCQRIPFEQCPVVVIERARQAAQPQVAHFARWTIALRMVALEGSLTRVCSGVSGMVPADDYVQSLPRKRMATGALFVDSASRILLVSRCTGTPGTWRVGLWRQRSLLTPHAAGR